MHQNKIFLVEEIKRNISTMSKTFYVLFQFSFTILLFLISTMQSIDYRQDFYLDYIVLNTIFATFLEIDFQEIKRYIYGTYHSPKIHKHMGRYLQNIKICIDGGKPRHSSQSCPCINRMNHKM